MTLDWKAGFENNVAEVVNAAFPFTPIVVEWVGGSMFIQGIDRVNAVLLNAELDGRFGTVRMGELGQSGEFYFDFIGE